MGLNAQIGLSRLACTWRDLERRTATLTWVFLKEMNTDAIWDKVM